MIAGCFTDFSALCTVLKLEKMVSGVLEQYDVVITFILESLSKENKFQYSFQKNFKTPCFVFENYTSHWIITVFGG